MPLPSALPIRLTALAVVALAAGIAWYVAPLKPNIVVLQFAFTPRAFGEVVHAWPPEHLARYRVHLLADSVLLVAYGLLGYLLATRWAPFRALPAALRRSAKGWLPAAAAFDAAENGLHWWLTEVPRFGVPLAYSVSATCSVLKWLLLFAFGFVLLYALAKSEQ